MGATRELWKKTTAAGDVLVRLSIAELSGDQAFSVFPEIDRIILALDGPAVALDLEGRSITLTQSDPFAFPGEAAVSSRLLGPGPARDLNLMCRRQLYIPSMQVVTLASGQKLPIAARGFAGVIALKPCRLESPGSGMLDTGDLLVHDADFVVVAASECRLAHFTANAVSDPAG